MTYDPQAQARVLREELDELERTAVRLDAVLELPPAMRRHVAESIGRLRAVADDVEHGVILDEERCREVIYGAITMIREQCEDLDMVARRLG